MQRKEGADVSKQAKPPEQEEELRLGSAGVLRAFCSAVIGRHRALAHACKRPDLPALSMQRRSAASVAPTSSVSGNPQQETNNWKSNSEQSPLSSTRTPGHRINLVRNRVHRSTEGSRVAMMPVHALPRLLPPLSRKEARAAGLAFSPSERCRARREAGRRTQEEPGAPRCIA